ncbi:hypothetical protein [Dictyobacter kobayashii]|uniref:hypothetical protein n=1 Tax=Dictyobacter kobayashii TaxID=2014872 RepID=UPI001FE8CECA|nr:hypothetical protein [Dictyobacter kobayashii]
MNQNPEQPQQNNYTQYPQYDPTQAAQSPYEPTQAAPPSYPGNPGYPPPSTGGNSAPDYMPQSPYSPQSPYPQSGPYPQPGTYPQSGQPNPGGMYAPTDPYNPPAGTPPYPGYPPAPKKNRTWLWVTLGIVGVLLVALIASCAIFANAMTKFTQSVATTTPYTYATPVTQLQLLQTRILLLLQVDKMSVVEIVVRYGPCRMWTAPCLR